MGVHNFGRVILYEPSAVLNHILPFSLSGLWGLFCESEPLLPRVNPAVVRGILLGPESHQIWQPLILCLFERKLSKYIQNAIHTTVNPIVILKV